jgi:hypothetical protein
LGIPEAKVNSIILLVLSRKLWRIIKKEAEIYPKKPNLKSIPDAKKLEPHFKEGILSILGLFFGLILCLVGERPAVAQAVPLKDVKHVSASEGLYLRLFYYPLVRSNGNTFNMAPALLGKCC